MNVFLPDLLPDVPWLNGLFVKAGLMDVVSRYRGAMADVMTDAEANDVFEVSGEAARADLLFGPEMNLFKTVPRELVEVTEEAFALTGYARVSRLRCNPMWTFVEQHAPLEGEQYALDTWLGVPSIAIWSLDEFWDARGALSFRDRNEGPAIREGFSYHDRGSNRRWVEYTRNAHDGEDFTIVGAPEWFEKTSHYTAVKKRGRMSRAVLFEVLGELGIDAVSVFGRRELDEPHLYTTRIRGRSCAAFEDDRRRLKSLGL